MVDAYTEAIREVEQAYNLIKSASQRMGSAFGSSCNSVIYGYSKSYSHYDFDLEQSKKRIKINAWACIINKMNFRNFLSDKKKKELDEQLEKGELPDLTVQNIFYILNDFAQSLPDMFEESVIEVFEYLRPRESEYKTNTEFEIKNKVILNSIIDCDKYFVRMSYYYQDKIRNIDNVFHLLDGKGPIKYPGDLVTKIQTAIQEKKWYCDTEYFDCKWYKKGTLHIRFKRMDLVNEINRIAGGNKLREK